MKIPVITGGCYSTKKTKKKNLFLAHTDTKPQTYLLVVLIFILYLF